MKYYLIRGNQIISTIDAADTDRIAMPLLGGGDAMSLMNEQHAQNLMTNLGLTASEALDALGVADLRSGIRKSVFIGSDPTAGSVDTTGLATYHLIDIGNYSLWQVDGQQEDLLSLHDQLWQMEPTESLGLLAVVNSFGSSFYDAAVRTATGMTVEQVLARRDRVASYLESLGYTDTDALRAATNEDTQIVGVVTALGYTETQLWNAMVE